MLTNKEILIEAKSLVERGWCQLRMDNSNFRQSNYKSLYQPPTSWCALGAITETLYKNNNSTEKAAEIMGYVEKVNKISNLVKWNDTEGRTQKEVLDAFQNAIDSLKE